MEIWILKPVKGKRVRQVICNILKRLSCQDAKAVISSCQVKKCIAGIKKKG